MSAKVAFFLVCVVALLQTFIAVFEVFLWNRPWVHGRLDFSDAEAKKVAPIVANAGLYNGFLAAGLIWGMNVAPAALQIETFFLSCVVIAGVSGAVTLKPTTHLLQTIPGTMALVALWTSRF